MTGGGDGMTGAGRLNAFCGGTGRGRGAATGGRASRTGASGCGGGFGEGCGLGAGARRTINEPLASPSLIPSGDGGRRFGSNCHNAAACSSSDSANATHMVGMVTPSRRSRAMAGPSLSGNSEGIMVAEEMDGARCPETSIVYYGAGLNSMARAALKSISIVRNEYRTAWYRIDSMPDVLPVR
jgi:hypothetical protein